MAKCIYEIRTPFFGLKNAGNPRKYGCFGGCIFFVQLFWQGQKDLKKQFRLYSCLSAYFCVVFSTLCYIFRTKKHPITQPECPNLRQILDRHSLLCNHCFLHLSDLNRSSEKGEYFFACHYKKHRLTDIRRYRIRRWIVSVSMNRCCQSLLDFHYSRIRLDTVAILVSHNTADIASIVLVTQGS